MLYFFYFFLFLVCLLCCCCWGCPKHVVDRYFWISGACCRLLYLNICCCSCCQKHVVFVVSFSSKTCRFILLPETRRFCSFFFITETCCWLLLVPYCYFPGSFLFVLLFNLIYVVCGYFRHVTCFVHNKVYASGIYGLNWTLLDGTIPSVSTLVNLNQVRVQRVPIVLYALFKGEPNRRGKWVRRGRKGANILTCMLSFAVLSMFIQMKYVFIVLAWNWAPQGPVSLVCSLL